ncbi:hypothetical protein M0805_001635 [Coniferiporia weirii]|nr:hypothetical protein M0805_001635 [Coniferiporia weirii]
MSSTDYLNASAAEEAIADLSNQQTTEPTTSVTPPRVRIARYDQYFNQRTFKKVLQKTSKPAIQKKLSKKRPVLVVRRLIDSRGQYEGTEIDIKSKCLCKVLMEINEGVKGLGLTKSRPVADPQLFFHSRIGIQHKLGEEKSRETPDNELIDDLTTALQFIEEDHGETIADFEMLTAHGEITFELLWTLFPPNTLVYNYHHLTEQPRILLAQSFSYVIEQGVSYARISFDIITNDGSAFGIARDYLKIKSFPGAYKILELEVYPFDFHENKSVLFEHAVSRGKKFAKIDSCCFEISGPAVRESSNMLGETKLIKFNTYGRVMIDPVAFRLFEPNSELNLPVHRQLEKDSLKDEDYLICTPVALGFCLGTKTWGGFAIDRLRDVIWSEEAFRRLVLGEKQKQLIHALVRQHSARAALFDDIVVGKGKGLIGLLSGNPGCGKTLTAEATAEITHRPLYVVSAGELGTQPEDVDQRLSRIFELAHIWNAVLLLDEAEVFLQERSTTDVARNALVSIFLRQLEYYQGILILTTNMLAQCDPAFESRIHFCVKYPDLDFESRKAVWKTFLGKALENTEDVSEESINRLAGYKMNGRQIKNAVSSAQSIALERNSRLLIEHIDTVLEVVSDWHTAKVDVSLI